MRFKPTVPESERPQTAQPLGSACFNSKLVINSEAKSLFSNYSLFICTASSSSSGTKPIVHFIAVWKEKSSSVSVNYAAPCCKCLKIASKHSVITNGNCHNQSRSSRKNLSVDVTPACSAVSFYTFGHLGKVY